MGNTRMEDVFFRLEEVVESFTLSSDAEQSAAKRLIACLEAYLKDERFEAPVTEYSGSSTLSHYGHDLRRLSVPVEIKLSPKDTTYTLQEGDTLIIGDLALKYTISKSTDHISRRFIANGGTDQEFGFAVAEIISYLRGEEPGSEAPDSDSSIQQEFSFESIDSPDGKKDDAFGGKVPVAPMKYPTLRDTNGSIPPPDPTEGTMPVPISKIQENQKLHDAAIEKLKSLKDSLAITLRRESRTAETEGLLWEVNGTFEDGEPYYLSRDEQGRWAGLEGLDTDISIFDYLSALPKGSFTSSKIEPPSDVLDVVALSGALGGRLYKHESDETILEKLSQKTGEVYSTLVGHADELVKKFKRKVELKEKEHGSDASTTLDLYSVYNTILEKLNPEDSMVAKLHELTKDQEGIDASYELLARELVRVGLLRYQAEKDTLRSRWSDLSYAQLLVLPVKEGDTLTAGDKEYPINSIGDDEKIYFDILSRLQELPDENTRRTMTFTVKRASALEEEAAKGKVPDTTEDETQFAPVEITISTPSGDLADSMEIKKDTITLLKYNGKWTTLGVLPEKLIVSMSETGKLSDKHVQDYINGLSADSETKTVDLSPLDGICREELKTALNKYLYKIAARTKEVGEGPFSDTLTKRMEDMGVRSTITLLGMTGAVDLYKEVLATASDYALRVLRGEDKDKVREEFVSYFKSKVGENAPETSAISLLDREIKVGEFLRNPLQNRWEGLSYVEFVALISYLKEGDYFERGPARYRFDGAMFDPVGKDDRAKPLDETSFRTITSLTGLEKNLMPGDEEEQNYALEFKTRPHFYSGIAYEFGVVKDLLELGTIPKSWHLSVETTSGEDKQTLLTISTDNDGKAEISYRKKKQAVKQVVKQSELGGSGRKSLERILTKLGSDSKSVQILAKDLTKEILEELPHEKYCDLGINTGTTVQYKVGDKTKIAVKTGVSEGKELYWYVYTFGTKPKEFSQGIIKTDRDLAAELVGLKREENINGVQALHKRNLFDLQEGNYRQVSNLEWQVVSGLYKERLAYAQDTRKGLLTFYTPLVAGLATVAVVSVLGTLMLTSHVPDNDNGNKTPIAGPLEPGDNGPDSISSPNGGGSNIQGPPDYSGIYGQSITAIYGVDFNGDGSIDYQIGQSTINLDQDSVKRIGRLQGGTDLLDWVKGNTGGAYIGLNANQLAGLLNQPNLTGDSIQSQAQQAAQMFGSGTLHIQVLSGGGN